MNTIRKRAVRLNRLRSSGGFSFTELMAATLILVLVSAAMAGGVSFAVRQYNKSMLTSEAKILCSTLANAVEGELSNAGTIKLGSEVAGSDGVYALDSYFSYRPGAGNGSALQANGSGHLVIANRLEQDPNDDGEEIAPQELVSSAVYSSYSLRASITVNYRMPQNGDYGAYQVTLRVLPSGSGTALVEQRFDVLPLNRPTVITSWT